MGQVQHRVKHYAGLVVFWSFIANCVGVVVKSDVIMIY